MAIRFFKKLVPRTPVILNDSGAQLSFSTLDNLTGYFATDNQGLQEQLVKFIEQGRYGMSEISEAEYVREYADKKKLGIRPSTDWKRETLSGTRFDPGVSPLQNLSPSETERAVAVDDLKPKPRAQQLPVMAGKDELREYETDPATVRDWDKPEPAKLTDPSAPKAPFVPTAGKRIRA